MSSIYDPDRAREVESLTGEDIHISGFKIPEDEWNLKNPRPPDINEIAFIGWMNVHKGQIVTLIEKTEEETADTNLNGTVFETNDIDLITEKPYRVMGLNMSEDEDPFRLSIVLQGIDDVIFVQYGDKNGVWSSTKEESIFEGNCACGVLSDKEISDIFGYEEEILSKTI